MNKKILILGRSASGKDTLAVELTKQFGLKQLCSTTTRPMRYENEDTHVFVTEEEANEMTDRVAETVINGYQYFATRQQLDECDIYVIDPIGLYGLCKNAPNTEFCIVYVHADDATRKARAIGRAANPEEASVIFDKRHADENGQFEKFEKSICNEKERLDFSKKYPNVKSIIWLENNESDANQMKTYAQSIRNMANHTSFDFQCAMGK